MVEQQERNNVNNNNNYDDSNTNNENSFFANESNSQMSKRQLSFITVPCKEQQDEKLRKVIKSFKVD